MSKKNDTRLCWNCHGDVSYHLDQCPYCGVSIGAKEESYEEQSSIPAPPYASEEQNLFENPSKKQSEYRLEEEEDSNPYELTQEEWNEALSAEQSQETPEHKKTKGSFESKQLLPIGLIFVGTLLVLFGLIIVFFAKDQILELSWSKKSAFLYLGLGVPFSLLGFLKVSNKS